MESNPMLEESWRIKDEWGRAAGEDIHRLWRNTHKWKAEHPDPCPVIHRDEAARCHATGVGGLEFDKDVVMEFGILPCAFRGRP
jgi:hypothetical protein